ncbi:MAG: hypothetical protein AAF065_02135 [Verrucomicrobiota bacterium]
MVEAKEETRGNFGDSHAKARRGDYGVVSLGVSAPSCLERSRFAGERQTRLHGLCSKQPCFAEGIIVALADDGVVAKADAEALHMPA